MKNLEDVYRFSPRQRDLLAREAEARPASILRLDVHGAIDDAALDRAAQELVRRQPALRSAFFPKGLKEPVQVVRDRASLYVERDDASALSADERRARVRDRLAALRSRPFNLGAAPLARLVVIRLAPERHHVLFAHHALILDERSAVACVEQMFALHRAFARGDEQANASATERAASYRDYVAWVEQQDLAAAERTFAPLREARRPTALGAAPPPGAPSTYLTQRISLSVDATSQLQATIRQHRVSLAAVVEAAWAALLAQHASADAVVFGSAHAGRPATLPKSDAAVGRFAGALPRRVVLPPRGAALVPWIQRLKSEKDAARPRAFVALDQIRAWTGAAPGEPLFESAVFAEAAPDDEARASLHRSLGLRDLAYEATPESSLDVRADLGQRLVLGFVYDATRFASPEVARIAAHLAAIVEALAARPEQPLEALPRAAALPISAPRPPATTNGKYGFSPEDVEAILRQHPTVDAAEVTAEGGAPLVARVVARRENGGSASKKLDFSMFYFADANAGADDDKYRIYLEGAAFADKNGFAAVWTPERHFHENGGLYPNPAVLSAALATMTSRVKLRAGSVVVPIHHPLRIAEEWSVVDNLSKGRVGVSVASGWVPNDFAFAPHHYEKRREAMFRGVEEVRALWAGGTIAAKDGAGNDVALRVFPRPVQRELPMWLTAAGSPETFEKAGELGFNVLTSLLAQSIDEARDKIALYRAARARAGHDPDAGIVTMMVHTFLGDDYGAALEKVREPFTAYLRSHVALMKTLVESLDLPIDITEPKWLDYLASFAFEKYSRQGALLGTATSCLPLVEKLRAIGVDEIACLVDFGVDADSVIEGFAHLDELRRLAADEALLGQRVLAEYVAERLPDHGAPIDFQWASALPARPEFAARADHAELRSP